VLRRWHVPTVTEDGVFSLWVFAVPWQKTAARRRFSQDPEGDRQQEKILETVNDNKRAAVLAVSRWIRRIYVDTDEQRQLKIREAEGAALQARQPIDPGFSAEEWVYPAYGPNVIEDRHHDVVKALRGVLDDEPAR
jgi:hypothetical protein